MNRNEFRNFELLKNGSKRKPLLTCRVVFHFFRNIYLENHSRYQKIFYTKDKKNTSI